MLYNRDERQSGGFDGGHPLQRYPAEVYEKGRLLKHGEFVLIRYGKKSRWNKSRSQTERWRFLYILSSPHFAGLTSDPVLQRDGGDLSFFALAGLPRRLSTGDKLRSENGQPLYLWRFDETRVMRKRFFLRWVTDVLDPHSVAGQRALEDCYGGSEPPNEAMLTSRPDNLFSTHKAALKRNRGKFRTQADPLGRWANYGRVLHSREEWYNLAVTPDGSPNERFADVVRSTRGTAAASAEQRRNTLLRAARKGAGTRRSLGTRPPRELSYKMNAALELLDCWTRNI